MARPTETQTAQPSPAMDKSPQAEERKRLPRRDYFILPLLSFLTVALLGGLSEGICRLIWTQQYHNSCGFRDPRWGTYYLPNCVSRTKVAEGPWFENRYNACGYRTNDSCGPKPPGDFRIAIIGSSGVGGWGVPYEQTFVSLISRDLTRICGRTVEIQNISTLGHLLEIYHRSQEALALNPDLVVLFLGGIDTHGWYDRQEFANRDNPAFKPSPHLAEVETLAHRLVRITDSRAWLVARHFLYQDAERYAKALTLHPVDSDFMLDQPPPAFDERLADLDILIGEMAEKFRARGIPFAILPTVSEPQALLLSSHRVLPGFDPLRFERNLAAIGSAHKIPVLNIYDDFVEVPYTRLVYVADGHLTAEGNAVLSRGFVRETMARGMISGCRLANLAGGQGKSRPKLPGSDSTASPSAAPIALPSHKEPSQENELSRW